jgi:uncharacterized protein YndB with AHSA1/START domain
MRPVSASITIDVPRERVFDLLADLSIRPAFTDHFMQELRLTRVEPAGEGAAARFRLREGKQWMDSAIVAAERPHLLREHGLGGRSNLVETHLVWELAEGPAPSSSEVTVTFWTEPKSFFAKLREARHSSRRLRRDFKRALGRLRELAESGDSPPRVEVAGGDRLPAFVR